MKYQVTLDGERVDVELVERDGRTFVVGPDGTEEPADLVPVREPGSWSLILGDRSHELAASGDGAELTLHIGSETWSAAVVDEREALLVAALGERGARRGGVVRSVMPGIVREVRVAAGEAVERGAPLVILEAMKMQNEIRAESDGTVIEVHVAPGTAVAKGDALVTLG